MYCFRTSVIGSNYNLGLSDEPKIKLLKAKFFVYCITCLFLHGYIVLLAEQLTLDKGYIQNAKYLFQFVKVEIIQNMYIHMQVGT